MPAELRRRSARPLVAVALALAACGAGNQPSAERGKQIYCRGESPSGDPLTVALTVFGDASRVVPGNRYACTMCHGPEGLPRTEGGVAVPDIRAHRLGVPSLGSGNQRRSRVAYDDARLGRAIRMGVDASGNVLAPLMPRFDISDRDLADLRAYLAQLGSEAVPGVAADAIAIATLLPDDGPGAAALATLRAFADDIDAAGGIYGRRLRIEPRRAIVSEDAARCFAVVGADATLLPADSPLPVVGAFGDDALLDPPLQPWVFWLQASQATQLGAAVDHWTDTLQHAAAHFAVALPADLPPVTATAITADLASAVARHPGARLHRLQDAELDCAPQAEAATVVLLAGDAATKSTLLPRLLARTDVAAVYAAHRLPPELIPALPAEHLGKLRLLLPMPLPDEQDPAVQSFREFLMRHRLPETFVAARASAWIAARLFVEGLERAGAHVTRERLVRELGTLHRFRPGLSAPLTYGLNQRVGARGAQVAGVDPAARTLQPQSSWTEVR